MKSPRFWRFGLVLSIAIPLTILITGCLRIERVNQPPQARTGEFITMTVAAYPEASPGSGSPYLGIHLPDGWAVIPPVSYTGSYTGNITYAANLSGKMEDISPERNYYWWVGIGNEHEVSTPGQTATGTLRIQINNQAGFYYLDYMTGDSMDGLNFDLRENIPLTVTADYGAGWQPIASYKYPASKAMAVNIPVTLVDLGESGPDTFNLQVTPPAGWAADFYTNTVITNTGPLMLYQSLPLTVQLTIPAEALPGRNLIPITATSTTDPNATASAVIDFSLLSDRRGYILTQNNAAWEVDPVTYQIIAPLSYQPYAESLALHPQGQYLYATFPDNISVSPENVFAIIDAKTQKLVTFRTVGVKPGVIAFTCTGDKALIADQSSPNLYFFNTTFPNFPTYSTTIAGLPGVLRDIAVSCDASLALIANENSDNITVIDTSLMTISGSIPGFHRPGSVVIASKGQRAYVANEDGTIGVIDVPRRNLLTTWDVNNTSAAELGLAANGDTLYAGASGRLLFIDTATGQITASINLLESYSDVQDIEVSADDELIFVAHNHRPSSPPKAVLSIIDAASHQLIDAIHFDQDGLRKLALYPPTCACQKVYLPLVQKK